MRQTRGEETVKQTIITLLTDNLSQEALQINSADARFEVVAWTNPLHMLKQHLQNEKVHLLFTVKNRRKSTARILQHVPHRYDGFYDVAVWLIESPAYQGRGDKDALRDAAVGEVTRIFDENPSVGTVREVAEDDHTVGQIKVISSVVVVEFQEHQ